MKLSLTFSSFVLAFGVISVTASGSALADDASVSCVDGKFGDHVEKGQPSGDAASIAAAHKVVYWVDVANTGDATQVTLVWNIDGKEVQRQSLDVGHSPHWRTWGTHPTAGGKTIAIQVLDSSGKSLKDDSITLEGT